MECATAISGFRVARSGQSYHEMITKIGSRETKRFRGKIVVVMLDLWGPGVWSLSAGSEIFLSFFITFSLRN